MNNEELHYGIPSCLRHSLCHCFDNLCQPIQQQHQRFEIGRFIFDHLKWVDKYFTLLKQHIFKDKFNRTDIFSKIPAHTLKNSIEFLNNTLAIFEYYILQTQCNDFLIHYSYNNGISGKQLIFALKNSSSAHINLIQTLSYPHQNIDIECLLSILEIHIFCLCIFEQFYNIINYGCNFYGPMDLKKSYRITLSICR